MKIAAIISHRNELPANLHRTYYHLKSHGIEVELLEDLPAMGCGYRRHQLIMQTKADAVVICDAHMKFSPGYFETVAEHLEKHWTDITVSRMQSLNHDWTEAPGQLYAGAEIRLEDRWPGEQHIPIAAKWRADDGTTGPVGAVMGACYGIHVERYREMGCPLAILRAWGGDEELLSIASWMTGGRVHLIPGTAYHMFAAPRAKHAPLAFHEELQIWANRLAMLTAIPMADTTKIRLLSWLKLNRFVKQNGPMINAEVDRRMPDIERLHEALDGLMAEPITFEQYIEQWGRKQPNNEREDAYMAKAAKADKERRETVKEPVKTKPRTCTSNIRVMERGTPCPHCGYLWDHRTTNSYPNQNRRVVCGGCSRPFIIFRKAQEKDLIENAKIIAATSKN